MGRSRGNCCGSSCSACINVENFDNYEYAIFLCLDRPGGTYYGHGLYDLYINDTFIGDLDEMFIYPGEYFNGINTSRYSKWLTTDISVIDTCRTFLSGSTPSDIPLGGLDVYTNNIDVINNENKKRAFFSESFHFLLKEKIALLPDENYVAESIRCSPYWAYMPGSGFFGRFYPITRGRIYVLRINKVSGQICLIAYNNYSGYYGDDAEAMDLLTIYLAAGLSLNSEPLKRQNLCCRTKCYNNTEPFNSLVFEVSDFSLYQFDRNFCIQDTVISSWYCENEYYKHPFFIKEDGEGFFNTNCNSNLISLNGSYILNKSNDFSGRGLDFCSTKDFVTFPSSEFSDQTAYHPRRILLSNDYSKINICDKLGFGVNIFPGFREMYKKLCFLNLGEFTISRPQLYGRGDLDVDKNLCKDFPTFSTFKKQAIKLPRIQIKISRA